MSKQKKPRTAATQDPLPVLDHPTRNEVAQAVQALANAISQARRETEGEVNSLRDRIAKLEEQNALLLQSRAAHADSIKRLAEAGVKAARASHVTLQGIADCRTKHEPVQVPVSDVIEKLALACGVHVFLDSSRVRAEKPEAITLSSD